MKKKIHVATSPLTGTIYAGHTLKSGIWGAWKQDVTINALVAVAHHALKFGQPVIISNQEGKPEFKITVERI